MSTGYICVFTLPEQPDFVTLFGTEYCPEFAVRTLNQKLAATFQLNFSTLVQDPVKVLHELRLKLRQSQTQELYGKVTYKVSVDDIYSLLQEETDQLIVDHSMEPDFFQETLLDDAFNEQPKPRGQQKISQAAAAMCEANLSLLGRQGHCLSLKRLADIYRTNHSNSLKFKTYWREYLAMSLKKTEFYGHKPKSLGCTRADLAREVVEYLWLVFKENWFDAADIRYIKSFLQNADQYVRQDFIYELGNNQNMIAVKKHFVTVPAAVSASVAA